MQGSPSIGILRENQFKTPNKNEHK